MNTIHKLFIHSRNLKILIIFLATMTFPTLIVENMKCLWEKAKKANIFYHKNHFFCFIAVKS